MKKINLTKLLACAVLLGAAQKVSAQMTGGSVFLKGKYVEAGICANGDFGASGAPTGYHVRQIYGGGGTLLGFVADPAMDGWTVGTPAYTGDFFYTRHAIRGIQYAGGYRESSIAELHGLFWFGRPYRGQYRVCNQRH